MIQTHDAATPTTNRAGWRLAAGHPAFRSFPFHVAIAAAGLLVLLARTCPVSFWEYDELLFAAAVDRFEPLLQHPHPPGYPAYIGLGKAVHLFAGSPFAALVALSILLSVVGMVALALAFGNLLDDDWLGLAGALLFYLSPGMLVHASLPLSDAPALALFAVAIWRSTAASALKPRDAGLTGVFAALAVGCRPQLSLMVVPFLLGVALGQRWRTAGAALIGSFAATCLVWFVPLVVATGGPVGWLRYEFAQASEVAAFDADLARSGWTGSLLIVRFVSHAWGVKLLSLPVLVSAIVGLISALRHRETELAPLVVAGVVYLVVAVASMDPIDGVRYGLPGTMVVALLAARGLAGITARVAPRRRVLACACAAAAGLGFLRYSWPVLGQRHASPSPPVQAAAYARDHLPSGTVVLFDRSLAPHARELFATFDPLPLAAGLNRVFDRADVPVAVLADGASRVPGAATFSWRYSDAYGKLTRNHYRVVSLISLPQGRRYGAVSGVYEPERTVDGNTWRWLAPDATIRLLGIGAARVEIRLALPADYPSSSLPVTVRAGSAPIVRSSIAPGQEVTVAAPLPRSPAIIPIEIHAARGFVPASVPGLRQRDRRTLGVMLTGLEQVQ